MIGRLLAFLMVFAVAAVGEIVPPDRRVDWTQVGIPGGIPYRTTIYTNLYPGVSAAQINAAIAACPSNQVVYLTAGTYNISDTLTPKSFMTLRGAGPTQTIIVQNVAGAGISISSSLLSGNAKTIALASGYAKGSTNLVLAASDSSLHAGFHVTIDQLNDNVLVNNYGVGGFRTDTTPEADGLRSLNQTFEVKSINGTSLTVWPPLYWTYSSALSPQIYYRPSSSTTANYALWAGIEDLCVSNINASATFILYFNRAAYCWARNVYTRNAGAAANGAHMHTERSYRGEIRHCYSDGCVSATSGRGYGIDLEYQTCAFLVEDNIMANNRDFIKVDAGGAGNVIAYNYHNNAVANPDVPSFAVHTGGHHSAHPMMNLWEGNITYKWVSDFYWGSVSHSTLLRNWFKGPMPYAHQSGAAMIIDTTNTYFNIVGNVLGQSNLTSNANWTTRSSLKISPANHAYEYDYATFRIGYYSDGDSGGAGLNGTNQWNTHIVAGNYDYVDRTQHWYNPATADAIPSSYYLTSKPAYFGTLAWPPFDASNVSTVNDAAIPAGYRYLNGIDPPAGGLPSAPTIIHVE